MLDRGKYVSPKRVGDWFLSHADRESGEAITHLKLQKLIYYAQAWYLANFDRPLFKEDMQAWAHGPVSPSVYGFYRNMGWEALPPNPSAQQIKGDLNNFLAAVYDHYGIYSAKKLERMTHDERPWKSARGNLPAEARCTNPIDKLDIRNFYAKRLGKKEIKTLLD